MRIRNIVLTALTILFVSGAILYSCTRKKADYLGPEYLSAPSDFTASNLTATDPINFASGVCNITATFSHRVTYTVTITGLTSGAEKVYTGVGSLIDAAAIGGIWNGSHDGLYFFRSGEQALITLTFLRSEVKLSKVVTITTKRNFVLGNPYLLAVGGSNNSYELPATVRSSVCPTCGFFPFQFSFSEGLAGPTSFAEDVLASANSVNAVDGLKVLKFAGKSAQGDGFFIGGIQHRKGNPGGNISFMLPATWKDPSQIYFNVYIYGNGNSKATVNLEFHESDYSNSKNDYVAPLDTLKKECGGTPLNKFDHDPCTDDGWVSAIPVDFVGWRLVSVKYSDFVRSVSLPNGGSGDGIKEPTRVARIQMGVVARPAFAETNVLMDYPIISYGAPFDPSK